ncbi:hypothetical protein AWW69_12300 [Bacillus cereus]|nr:hypothetical protein AWW69_12300 [Bacillus cereus]
MDGIRSYKDLKSSLSEVGFFTDILRSVD